MPNLTDTNPEESCKFPMSVTRVFSTPKEKPPTEAVGGFS